MVPLETLLPHEQVEEHRVDNLEKMTLRWRAYTKPLLVDGKTGTILDGHHRTKVAERMSSCACRAYSSTIWKTTG